MEQQLKVWDKRVVGAMNVADSVRKGAIALRVIGLLVIAAGLAGNYLLIYRNDAFAELGGSDTPDRLKLGQLLQQSVFPIAFGGLVLGLSFFVAVYASRLDLDIAHDANEESS